MIEQPKETIPQYVERKYGTMDQTQNNFSERYLLEAVPN
jgi:hypothetical protein